MSADRCMTFEEVILNTVIQALTKQNIDESNILSAIASDLISKAQTGEVLKFKSNLEGVFPCSNNDVFNKLLSTISVVLTKAGIKQKIPGLLAVLTNTLLILGSYLLVNNVALAKLIAESVFVVSYLLFNYFIVPKTMLHQHGFNIY